MKSCKSIFTQELTRINEKLSTKESKRRTIACATDAFSFLKLKIIKQSMEKIAQPIPYSISANVASKHLGFTGLRLTDSPKSAWRLEKKNEV